MGSGTGSQLGTQETGSLALAARELGNSSLLSRPHERFSRLPLTRGDSLEYAGSTVFSVTTGKDGSLAEGGTYVGAIFTFQRRLRYLESVTHCPPHPAHHICPHIFLTNEEIPFFKPLQHALMSHVRRTSSEAP